MYKIISYKPLFLTLMTEYIYIYYVRNAINFTITKII